MSRLRISVPLAVAAAVFALGGVSPISAASAATRPAPAPFDVQTKTVTFSDVSVANPYISFTVPDCVNEIAYVMNGAAGGSSRMVGTAQYAAGGAGSVRAGTLSVTPGETLRLYPAQKGVDAQPASSGGTAGAGGAGWTAGGGGSGMDQSGVRQNAGGGGGGSAAIVAGASTPIVIAAGAGGAGGDAWSSATNTAVGGDGDMPGRDGVGTSGTAGALNATTTGAGGLPTQPSGNGGGGGGGGAGYKGGGGGKANSGSNGGGSGAGGTSFLDSARAGTGAISAYGLATTDATAQGNGLVKIAWFGCASVVSLDATLTNRTGTTTPAAGWSITPALSAGMSSSGSTVLDSGGHTDLTLRGFASAADASAVTIQQESRAGWVMRNWTDSAVNVPLATCLIDADPARPVAVTNADANSFTFLLPTNSWVSCTVNTVEADPAMNVSSLFADLTHTDAAPNTVIAGDRGRFSVAVTNTGNIPLTLAATDPKLPNLSCAANPLLPGATTSCSATTSVFRD